MIVTLRTPNRAFSDLSAAEGARQRTAIDTGSDAVEAIVNDNGGQVVHRYHSVPYVALEVPPATIAALRRSPTRRVGRGGPSDGDRRRRRAPLSSAPPRPRRQGFPEADSAVAVLDTGIDSTHPYLAGKVVDESCFSGIATCPNGQVSQLGAGAAAPCTYAPNDCRHGTHVAGIAVGGPAAGAPFTGVAPAAKLVAVQVFSRFTDPICAALGKPSPCALALNGDMLAGLEHVYDVAASLRVASVNMSIGGLVYSSYCDANVLKPAIDNLRSIGVATVIAAGNNSTASGISEPGCISSAIAVGATTKSDTVASYSNSASMMKLWAPGSAIRSSVPGGGYADFNGTSMATPHVAGAFALARQLYPGDSVTQILRRFRLAGVPITDARNGLTFPRLEIVGALAPVSVIPGTTAVEEGKPIAIPLTLTRTSTLPITATYVTYGWTAADGLDFVGGTGTVTFAPGTSTATAVFAGIEDLAVENDEIVLVSFFGATNAAMGGAYGLGGALIVDDD